LLLLLLLGISYHGGKVHKVRIRFCSSLLETIGYNGWKFGHCTALYQLLILCSVK